MERSARWGLPFLAAGQAQKEWTHNEALALIDLGLEPAVEALDRNDPPADPAEGQGWIVGPAPTGAWTGRATALAGWTSGGWRFLAPRPGMAVWVLDQAVPARWTGTAWIAGELRARRLLVDGVPVVGAQQPAIAVPAGGTVQDQEARVALGTVLATLRAHGLIAG
jgi:hypothetical protein